MWASETLLDLETAFADTPVGDLVRELRNGVHLAVMQEPFLGLVEQGEKTIESRWSRHRIPPFRAIDAGDLIVFKRSSGPITGLSQTRLILDGPVHGAEGVREFLAEYGARLCLPATDENVMRLASTHYMTLCFLGAFHPIPEGRMIRCNKPDRRGWVPLRRAVLSKDEQEEKDEAEI